MVATLKNDPNCQIVMKYTTKIRNSIKKELSELQGQGNWFNLSFEDWTSIKIEVIGILMFILETDFGIWI